MRAALYFLEKTQRYCTSYFIHYLFFISFFPLHVGVVIMQMYELTGRGKHSSSACMESSSDGQQGNRKNGHNRDRQT